MIAFLLQLGLSDDWEAQGSKGVEGLGSRHGWWGCLLPPLPPEEETMGLPITKVPVFLLFVLQEVANLILWRRRELEPVFQALAVKAAVLASSLGSSTEAEGT